MIGGMHTIFYSKDAEADRAFLRDLLGFRSVDAGQGWLIFALPPSEAAVHPDHAGGRHEMYLMCDDVGREIAALRAKGVPCADAINAGWGLLTRITLPGGGEVGLYQPRHARPTS